jgi:hypothetical protein
MGETDNVLKFAPVADGETETETEEERNHRKQKERMRKERITANTNLLNRMGLTKKKTVRSNNK